MATSYTASDNSDWSDRVSEQIAAFRARNTLRNDPQYVLEVEERIAARNAGVTIQDPFSQPVGAEANSSEDALTAVTASLSEIAPKRNWFGFKQR